MNDWPDMRYLTEEEVIELHLRIIKQTGGASGIRDVGVLQSAIVQPKMTFGGVDLYETIGQKIVSHTPRLFTIPLF